MAVYKPSPTALKFHVDDSFVRGVVGPIGCMAGDTLVVTQSGLQRFDSLDGSIPVLSWNEALGRTQWATTLGAYQKGTEALYEITTRYGTWRAASHHWVFCGDRGYQRVDTLAEGDQFPLPGREDTTGIVSIRQLDEPEPYWDMHVMGTNNYITADGAVHHNSGKSVMCCHEIFFRAKQQMPNPRDGLRYSRWLVVRNTYKQLKRTTLKTWLEWFPDGPAGQYKVSDDVFHLAIDDVRCEIVFQALDNIDDLGNLLSLELTGAWINEAREVPWSLIDGLTGRVRRYPKVEKDKQGNIVYGPSWSGIIADTNPCDADEDEWWYRLFEIEANRDPLVAERYKVFHQPPAVVNNQGRWELNTGQTGLPPAENISNHIDPEAYYLDFCAGKDPETIKVYAEGRYGITRDGKAVFPGYDDEFHCHEFDVDPSLPVYVGWDYGLGGQACVLAQLSARGQLRIFEEFVARDVGLYQFVKQVVKPGLAKWGPLNYRSSTGDPYGSNRENSDERTAMMILNDQHPEMLVGLPFTTQPADTNALQPRLDAVNYFLMQNAEKLPGEPVAPLLIIHPRCTTLRKGFIGMYRFKRIQGQDHSYKEVPHKDKHSHPHDALQMLCRGILSDYVDEPDEPVYRRASGASPVTGY